MTRLGNERGRRGQDRDAPAAWSIFGHREYGARLRRRIREERALIVGHEVDALEHPFPLA